ncbi:MAG: hypothetical protein EOM83_05660 [Clostridia bacterium]|nr:hypothetical protein [Clostridia bacterium]
MITRAKYPFALMAAFLWIGFVGAISFMEAWLKFRAPGLTLPVALEIGRLVFGALNIVEWVFAILILANIVFDKHCTMKRDLLWIGIPVLMLLLQTIWLLPALGVRTDLQIQGGAVGPSYQHFYYVGMEMVKVVFLFIFGFKLFKY